mgnify:CR=1 FL=1
MTVLLFFIVTYILLSISLYFLFPKAGVSGIKGLIPGVNFVEWAKLIGRKPAYALLLLIPIVNIFIYCGMAVDLVRSFGKLEFKHTAAAVIYAPAIFFKIAFNEKDKYTGPILTQEAEYTRQIEEAKEKNDNYALKRLHENNPYKKSTTREWVESLVFAVFAAAFIRMFLIEAYVIPTPSMEGSLNVGDFLFVSKAHYGIRTPMTVAMVPLLHNRIPGLNTESYIKEPSLPYYRLPAIQDVQRGEPFVFNWPVGDSVYITPERSYTANQLKRMGVTNFKQFGDLIVRPIDKKDHYIKRCVAIAGDTLSIKDGRIYIDGEPEKVPTHRQFRYTVELPQGANVYPEKLDKIGIDMGDSALKYDRRYANLSYVFQLEGKDILFLDDAQVQQLKEMYPGIKIEKEVNAPDPARVFPHSEDFYKDWSVDNYGPIWIPAKGESIALTPKNIEIYGRAIRVYEGNTLTREGGQYFVNGKATKRYTFKQDYYWAMGDNRHNSEDSRAWGFVPHHHIVGKPLFIWFSTKEGNISNGINWDRIFMSANVD